MQPASVDPSTRAEPSISGSGVGAAPAAGRLDYVDGLRGLAALLVVFYHAGHFFFGFDKPDRGPILGLVSTWHIGVAIFLVLSGFCIGLPYLRRDLYRVEVRSFALRRALRILPPYYLVMIPLAALTLLPAYQMRGKAPTDHPDFVLHLLMLHNLFAENITRISGQFWSLALETQLYVAFPLLMLLARRPWAMFAATVAIAALWHNVVGRFADVSTPDKLFTFRVSVFAMLPAFAMGIMAAAAVAKGRHWPRAAGAAGLLALVACFGLGQSVLDFVPLYYLASLAAALLLGSELPRAVLSSLSYRPLVRIGEVSYSLYLIHNAILGAAGAILQKRLDGPALAVAAILASAACVVLAFPCFRLIEKPFIDLHRRIQKKAA